LKFTEICLRLYYGNLTKCFVIFAFVYFKATDVLGFEITDRALC
jgi:hypothetical protein